MQKGLGYIFDIGLLSFNDGTYPMYKFVSNIIYNQHFVFSFLNFPQIIRSDIGIMIDSGQGTHMQMFFKRPVGHWMYSGLSMNTGPRSVFKRHYATIASQLFRIVVSGKKVREYREMKCGYLSNSSHR
ncbi:MAG: hypothetical protein V7705_12785, partial [Leeuwenhoekiella marinoflava]